MLYVSFRLFWCLPIVLCFPWGSKERWSLTHPPSRPAPPATQSRFVAPQPLPTLPFQMMLLGLPKPRARRSFRAWKWDLIIFLCSPNQALAEVKGRSFWLLLHQNLYFLSEQSFGRSLNPLKFSCWGMVWLFVPR